MMNEWNLAMKWKVDRQNDEWMKSGNEVQSNVVSISLVYGSGLPITGAISANRNETDVGAKSSMIVRHVWSASWSKAMEWTIPLNLNWIFKLELNL